MNGIQTFYMNLSDNNTIENIKRMHLSRNNVEDDFVWVHTKSGNHCKKVLHDWLISKQDFIKGMNSFGQIFGVLKYIIN